MRRMGEGGQRGARGQGCARERARQRARGASRFRLKRPWRGETHLLTCPSSSSRASGSAGPKEPHRLRDRDSPTRKDKNSRRLKFRARELALLRLDRAQRAHSSIAQYARTTHRTHHVPQDARFRHRAARIRRDPRRGRPQDHPQGTTRGAFQATRSRLADSTSGRRFGDVRRRRPDVAEIPENVFTKKTSTSSSSRAATDGPLLHLDRGD